MSKKKVLIDGKFCSRCKTNKPSSDFHNDRSSPTGLAHYCKECANLKARLNHKKLSDQDSWVASRREKQREAARLSKLKAIEFFGNVCFDCGKTYPPYVYDIHHLDGSTKLDNPSRLLRGNWSTAEEELKKCVLLCANCHRERHFNE